MNVGDLAIRKKHHPTDPLYSEDTIVLIVSKNYNPEWPEDVRWLGSIYQAMEPDGSITRATQYLLCGLENEPCTTDRADNIK